MESEKAQEFAALAEKATQDPWSYGPKLGVFCLNNRALILSGLRSQSGYVDGWRAGREAGAKCMDQYANGNHDDRNRATAIRALPLPEPNDGWRGIESAPKGQKIIAGYWNELGNWRSVMACYYLAGTLDIYEDSFETEDGFAPEGWYEESETHEKLLPMTTPTHWRPLPEPPIEEKL